MRLLLAALNLMDVGILSREEPHHEPPARHRFDGLWEILPKARHGHTKRLLPALDVNCGSRTQTTLLRVAGTKTIPAKRIWHDTVAIDVVAALPVFAST